MPAGRPAKYTDAEVFDKKVDEYVAKCAADEEPLTITGMALHLGFVDKCSLYEYQEKKEFTHSVKRARALVENSYEKCLRLNNAAGSIFALKNFGWKDKQDHDVQVSGNMSFKMNVKD